MELFEPHRTVGLSADEFLLLLAYRRCSPWRQTAIRYFAQALAGNGDDNGGGGDVIEFPKALKR